MPTRPRARIAGILPVLLVLAAVTAGGARASTQQPVDHPLEAVQSVDQPVEAVQSVDQSVETQRHLVPAYFYPDGSNWQSLCDKAETDLGGSIAVMNPASGPGTVTDPAYTEVIDYCHHAGQSVIGYVRTNYADRPADQVLGDVVRYYDLYPGLDGILFDEMSNEQSTKDYYRDLYEEVTSHSAAVVVGVPGVAAPTAWQVTAPVVADVLVVFEGSKASYDDWSPPQWVLDKKSKLFAQLVYDTASKTKMEKVCAASKDKNAGWVYVTDDDLPNPWDTLASYWKKETKSC